MKNFLISLLVLFNTNLTAQSFTDIDKDDDGLIEISNLETLNAMRYRLDGSGLKLNATAEAITTGCAVGGCKGYELTHDLDFNDVASYRNLTNMRLWTTDAGWQPIGTAEQPFTAIFRTNNSSTPNTIFNLKINRAGENNVGLFGHIGSTAEISGIGLLDAAVEGNHQVGGLVGKNAGGRISNSYVNGRVIGKGGEIGLLVGRSSGTITNSYANGEVLGEANGIGGLVGANHGEISNSYAMGSVVGSANNVGGLVGDNMLGTISNCYTTGSVSGNEDIGGLVGLSNLGTLIGNYVSGKASGTRYIGGLVGSNIGGTITQSYWDKTASKLKGNTGGIGLLASQLQSANAQDEDLKKPYYKWSTAHWDFGTAEQYPILKYATGSDLNKPACGPEQTLPNCGALLLGQHASLERILFLSDVDLSPNFKPTELNYQLNITTGTKTLQLIPIASNPDSTINISRNGTMIDSGIASGTTSSAITLSENTEIVIEVSAINQRPAQYSLTTHYLREITILGIPDKAIDEGEPIMLDASQNLETADTLMSYRWTQSRGKTLFPPPDSESAILWLHIPEDYVPATEEHANLGLTLEINDGKTNITKNITLTIAKVDNGNIPIGPPTLTILEGTAPEIDLSKDPDGSGKDFSYQWQSRAPGQDTEWINIDEATEKTHIISFLTESYTEYRVLISYTDGQGYKTIAASRAARYVPEIMILDSIKGLASEQTIPEDAKPQRSPNYDCSNDDIDDDNDGLIEICDLEALNAMRHVMDGSGYKLDMTATTTSTLGCAEGGCKGYELIKNLDFDDEASYSNVANKEIWTKGDGWKPIGSYDSSNRSNSNPFKAIFEGNNYTISNLMIKELATDHVGLFSYARGGTIKNVVLSSVKIKGRSNVGSLVGSIYDGTITNSTATGVVEGEKDCVGGLVGYSSSSTITSSYAIGKVLGNGHVGGLIGSISNGTITNSTATGVVEGEKDYVGGLVGSRYGGTITNSYAMSAVKGNSSYVGGLVGYSYSNNITNSYAMGTVIGGWYIGGLVGYNSGGTITNSYAMGAVKGNGKSIGGLVGSNRGPITNSYATGSVTGGHHVGGLVGRSSYSGTIMNSYATGTVGGRIKVGGLVGENYNPIMNSYATGAVSGRWHVGGLVGWNSSSNITNSYATGAVIGAGSSVGSLVGTNLSGTTIASYWDTETSRQTRSAGGIGKTMEELKSPITSGRDSTEIYYGWREEIWDFGASNQYPILKYAKGPDEDNPACSEQAGTDLPVCGSLLSPVLRGLKELRVAEGNLSPSFIVARQNYVGTVVSTASTIRFKPTALNPAATISISVNEGENEEIASGAMSSEIILNGTTKIIMNVKNGGTISPIEYTLHLDYYNFEGDIDMDDDGLIEINSLEELNAMHYQLDGTGYKDSEDALKIAIGCPGNKCKGYELMKDLDFQDAASYRDGNVNEDWTMSNRGGWQPIGDHEDSTKSNPFTAIFEGHGHTISNLMINRSNTDYVGLFGYIKGGTINNVGLSNIDIKGGNRVGGLVGRISYSNITNSHATGDVEGNIHTGGLAGIKDHSTIMNSYAAGNTTGTGTVGGLVSDNSNGTIRDSYATNVVVANRHVGGLVGYNYSGTITNSYATGSVKGDDRVGGLVGYNYSGTITASYWDTQTSEQTSSAGGTSKTTIELQEPTSASGIYAQWKTADWHFGTSNQYPALKYAVGPDIDNPACGSDEQQPACDTLLPLQRFVRLEQLTVSPGTLQFDPPTYDYNVTVDQDVDSITLNTTATGATIHITSNTSGVEYNTMDTSSITIPLTIAGDTIITIELTEGKQRPTRYTITVSHNVPDNPGSPLIKVTINEVKQLSVKEIPVNEGQQVELDTDPSSCTLVNVKCQLRIPVYSSLLSDPNILNFTIPNDFVEANQLTQKLVVVFSTQKDEEDIMRKETTFVVSKIDNGSISIGQPTLFGSQLIAPDLLGDPEGVQKSSVEYQWQRKAGGWVDISRATARTYTPGDMSGGEEYHVRISYTDGQGYCYGDGEGCAQAIYSEATRGDIDVNGNGLIEIRYINDLDAMRYVRDGSGYRKSSTASKIITGCPEDGCKGYELVADLDFNDNASYSSTSNKVMWTTGSGWQPIGDKSNSFSSTFKGNNHTISNLMINRESSRIGLFAMMNSSALIDGIDLYKVNIKGNDYVGALVGKNVGGTIKNSSVSGDNNTTSTIIGTLKKVGGLVGINDNYTELNPITVTVGKVINSFADVHVIGVRPDSGDNGSSVGGLIGINKGIISNSYASGNVSGNEDIGGLVGQNEGGEITNSYAAGTIAGTSSVGGLIGASYGTITHSYWDKTTNGRERSTDDMGKTTEQLQSPTTATGIYSSWSEEIWDFGTNKQYPALKGDDGTLLAGQRLGLQSLELSDKAILSEVFGNTRYSYIMFVAHGAETIQTTPTAADPDAEITLSTSNDSNETTQESGHHQINLAEDTSTITIVVKANNREVTYTFAVKRVEIQGGDNIMHNEGDSKVSLNASVVGDVINLDQVQDDWRWEQIEGKPLLATTTTQRIQFPIPVNYVVGDASSATVTLKVTGIFTRGDEMLESSAEVELTINKEDNGYLIRLLNAPRLEEATSQIGLHLVAPGLSDYVSTNRETDPDNGINADKITYQWQSLPPGSDSWSNIDTDGNEKTYKILPASPFNTQYRVKLGYTDGQGHRRRIEDGGLVSEAITVRYFDRDNNGLIDILSAEALAAIRDQQDMAATTSTVGCPEVGCEGYELKAHIDLSGWGNWEPIGDTSNQFNAIFEGNHYTISNLTINSSVNGGSVGLFSTTARTAEIRNVGLLNVKITNTTGTIISSVGGLIGSNRGKVKGSYVIAAKGNVTEISGTDKVGGLIGSNVGEVKGSYVIAKLIKGDSIVGGLVGFNSNTTITESYAIVKNINSRADSVGGLVGVTSGGEISNSYAKVDNMTVNKADVCLNGSMMLVGIDDDTTNPSVIIKSKMAGDCGAPPLFD